MGSISSAEVSKLIRRGKLLALLAALCFLLVLFKVSLGSIDLVALGLLFIALHLAFGSGFYPVMPTTRRR